MESIKHSIVLSLDLTFPQEPVGAVKSAAVVEPMVADKLDLQLGERRDDGLWDHVPTKPVEFLPHPGRVDGEHVDVVIPATGTKFCFAYSFLLV